MSAPTTPRPKPFAGARFREAARTNPGGARRQKVRCLVAAYLDAGCEAPPLGEMADRLGMKRIAVIKLIERLEEDGSLTVHRESESKRSRVLRYELRLPETSGR